MKTPQAERQVGGDYRLEVKDFGPIAEASVDVRPLTVFIGPSNTGKSYLAILMYALHRCFGGPPDPLDRRGLPRLMGWRMSWFREAMQPKTSIRKSLKAWLSKVAVQGGSLPALPMDVSAHIRSRLEQARGLDRSLEQEIRRCFGVDRLDDLIRRPSSHADTRVDLWIRRNADAETVRYGIQLSKGSVDILGKIGEVESFSTGIERSDDLDFALQRLLSARRLRTQGGIDDGDLEFILASLVEQLFRSLLRPFLQDTYYLPADRTGVMHSHQVVVSALIQNATMGGLRPPADIPMLSGVLGDFLEHLIVMTSGERRRPDRAKHSRRHDQRHDRARRLERHVLQGTVRIAPTETNYPQFLYRPEKWEDDLPLMRASSMVSELAPVVLYLRHLVEPGDVLIIEEPEAHLHPAMQAAFARELARLVRSGVRIILTTHSEWFLEQIGNLVRLSGLPEGRRQDIAGIEDVDVALRPDEVGAWLFKPRKRPKGSLVEEVKLDPDTGLYPTDYDKVSETLYNQSAMIFNRMQEGKGQ